MFQYIREQYELVQGSRETLFNYCSTLKTEDLVRENSNFGKGSIRNLLVHCVNTYNFWIGECALSVVATQIEPSSVPDMESILQLYAQVDTMIGQFITRIEKTGQSEFSFYLGGEKANASGIKLFSHVITHEYHHKGQILSMSRHLGYTPVDTDIMR